MARARMTRGEWLAAPAPPLMLEHLQADRRYVRTRAGRRKLRLFGGAACWRAYAALGPDDECRRLIEDAEAVADGRPAAAADPTRWRSLRPWPTGHDPRGYLVLAARLARLSDVWAASAVASATAAWAARPDNDPYGTGLAAEYHHNAELLRCIVGNPFRPVACQPHWQTSAVVGLAAAIYADRAFDRLPILADALEEAGCDHPVVLAHCRDSVPHARGCWVVDLILGRS